jgi:hypothetical protein
MQIDFKLFVQKHVFVCATTCSLGQLDEKIIIWEFHSPKILKQMATREMIIF